MGGSRGFLEKFSFMDHTLYCGCILSKSGAKSAQDLRSLSYYIYHFDKFSYHDFFEEEKIYFAAFYIKKFLKHYNLARNFGCLWKCQFLSATYLVFKKAASWIFHCYHVNDCRSKFLLIKGGTHFWMRRWPFLMRTTFN